MSATAQAVRGARSANDAVLVTVGGDVRLRRATRAYTIAATASARRHEHLETRDRGRVGHGGRAADDHSRLRAGYRVWVGLVGAGMAEMMIFIFGAVFGAAAVIAYLARGL